ncbi:MAG: HAMP domain-containing histidine kinase, partial [Nitrospira sp.]|nr:HAMP domain-containing histidine kinase [Nitrospira sp.]
MAESEHNSSVQGPGLPGSPGFRSWKTIIPLVVVAISLAASVTFAYSGALIHAGGIASLGCVVAMLVYIAGRRAEERVHFLSERVRAQEIAQQHQQQLIRADKMAALGVLVSGVAHEINNPNQFILLNSSLLDEVWQSSLPILDEYYNENGDFLLAGVPFSKMRERMPEACKGVERGARHIKRIVQSLKDYARDDAGDMAQVFDVNAVVEASATLLTSLIRKSTNNFTVIQSGLAAEVKGNFQKLEQVVVNLVQNSCQALADPDKAISVEV